MSRRHGGSRKDTRCRTLRRWAANAEGAAGPACSLVDEELADQLLDRAQAEGAELLGPDGLLSQLTKAVLERALEEEMTEHLGYEKHDPAGHASGQLAQRLHPKTVLTEAGAVALAVPRDRAGTLEPQIVTKGQRRLDGFDDLIIALYARGMTTRDISAHLNEIYDADVSPDLISGSPTGHRRDRRMAGPAARRGLPDPVHRRAEDQGPRRGGGQPAAHLAIGVDLDGVKNVLGLWVARERGRQILDQC